MMWLGAESLRSERLEYRRFTDADRAAVRAIVSDGSVTEPAGYAPITCDAEFEKFFTALREDGCAVVLRGEVIGYFRVFEEDTESEYAGKSCVGVGFVLARRYHGSGYGTEMLRFLTARLKRQFDFCFADAFTDNPASNRVITKCGYRYTEDYCMYFDGLGREITCRSYVF